MSNLEPGESYIYEKSDGVVYARKIGTTDRMVVGYDHKTESYKEELREDQLWRDIREAAKTNKSIAKAIERVKVLYRLSKDDPL